MKRLFGLCLLSALCFGGSALAQPPGMFGPYGMPPYPTARPQPSESPTAVLRGGIDKLIRYLHQENRPDTKEVTTFLESDIAPYFDFAYMAKWIAGPTWDTMTEKQRTTLASTIEERFLGTMAEHMADYDKQNIRFLRPHRRGGNDVTVSLGILNPGRYPSKLDFRMYRSQDGWKVFDVVANGQSAAAYYRQDFNNRWRQRPAAWGRG